MGNPEFYIDSKAIDFYTYLFLETYHFIEDVTFSSKSLSVNICRHYWSIFHVLDHSILLNKGAIMSEKVEIRSL